jgi:hypothetical protein
VIGMKNEHAVTSTSPTSAERPTAVPEQLALSLAPAPGIDPAHLPPQLRVSARTRTIGRAGIAEARAILAEQRQRRSASAIAA